MSITTAVRGAFRPFLDFVFPPTCLSCGNALAETERHVCQACLSTIPRLHSNHPLYCHTRDRLIESEVIAGLVSLFLFEKQGTFQALAHALKYDGFKSVGLMLGRDLGAEIKRCGMKVDCLIPVPLHHVKLRERGFNQAEAIARGASETSGIPVQTEILRRVRYTQTQTKLDQDQRKKNVEDAFSISDLGRRQTGMSAILIDDVITTGATIVAAGEALRKGGFEMVTAASLALAE